MKVQMRNISKMFVKCSPDVHSIFDFNVPGEY
jgi:hypothetical protein